MKMKYVKPEIDISFFDTEDNITVSGETVAFSEELTDSYADATYYQLFGN